MTVMWAAVKVASVEAVVGQHTRCKCRDKQAAALHNPQTRSKMGHWEVLQVALTAAPPAVRLADQEAADEVGEEEMEVLEEPGMAAGRCTRTSCGIRCQT